MTIRTAFLAVAFILATPGLARGQELDDDLKARYRTLTQNLICACRNENWTRTLEHCTDGCATPQKRQIRSWLAVGTSDDEILARMESQYGPKVIASAPFQGIHSLLYLSPLLILVAGGWVVYVFIRRKSPHTAAAMEAPAERDEAWERKVDAELEELP